MSKLPPKVHVKHGSYYYVHKNTWTRLSRLADGEDTLYKRLAEHKSEKPPETISELLRLYIRTGLPGKAPSTKREYERHVLGSKKTKPGPLMKSFGHMAAVNVEPADVAQYIESRGGVTANREMSTLSDMFQWAMRKGYVTSNPCRGVRRNPEKPRTRYLEDDELRKIIDAGTDYEAQFISAAYLTGMRQQDLIAMTKDWITDAGIQWREGKTGRRRLIAWSPTLWNIVEAALERSECERVFTNSSGQPWTKWGVQSLLRRIRRKSEVEGFTLHDIRAKAGSDAEDGRGLLAHASEAVFRRVYERKAKAAKPVR